MNFITVERQSGVPVHFRGQTVTPRSLAIQVKFPGLEGGLVYHRPLEVLIENADGQVHSLPIRNYTRQAMALIFGLTLVVGILLRLGRSRSRPVHN